MRPRRLIGGLTRNEPHVADMASEIKLLSLPVCFFSPCLFVVDTSLGGGSHQRGLVPGVRRVHATVSCCLSDVSR